MTTTNLRLRGGTYHWRRKFSLAGTPVSVSFSLRTGSYRAARGIMARLEVQARNIIMSYGNLGVAIRPDQMKAASKDAMRVQLDRILTDQIGNDGDPADDARTNRVFAEFWNIRARRGIDADFTPEHFDELLSQGWSPDDASCLAALCHTRRGQPEVSKRQLDDYASSFGITPTRSNFEKLQRLIYEARAAACLEASRQLPDSGFNYRDWIDEALEDNGPLAFETDINPAASHPHGHQAFDQTKDTQSTTATSEVVAKSECYANPKQQPQKDQSGVADPPLEAGMTSTADVPHQHPESEIADRKLLKEAAEDCISAVSYEDGWSPDTIKQVRTAIAMFDYACGGDVCIEAITTDHVVKFRELCRSLPNRWGRTSAERELGFSASLERAKEMDPSEVGISQKTMNKHLTWIAKVIDFSATPKGGGHNTAETLDFRWARKTLTKKGGRKGKRKRDLRANWTIEEVHRILSAPIWFGSASLDDRLSVGEEIFHDAWYFLPIMLPLYGGRSSELAGLRLDNVHENAPIPYIQIEYNEDRDLKNVQSVRKLPIHPELIRLGFI